MRVFRIVVNAIIILLLILTLIMWVGTRFAQGKGCGNTHTPCVELIEIPAPIFLPMVMK